MKFSELWNRNAVTIIEQRGDDEPEKAKVMFENRFYQSASHIQSKTLEDWSTKINEIRAKNGWIVELELKGIWIAAVRDKESHKKLAETGMTSIDSLLFLLEHFSEEHGWEFF